MKCLIRILKELILNFLKYFQLTDFGRRGNSLLYNSEGHDLISLMELLTEHGINKFTLALALQIIQFQY